jgi:mRNA-degrading endonuclease toxin of MazEF toxin-antitoxin module
MKEYKIAKVDFPFADKDKVKSRPCLIITKPTGKYKIVVIAYMTSSDLEMEKSDIILDETEKGFLETGLTKKTIIKLHRLEHISVEYLSGEVGFLSEQKSLEVKVKLRDLFEMDSTY